MRHSWRLPLLVGTVVTQRDSIARARTLGHMIPSDQIVSLADVPRAAKWDEVVTDDRCPDCAWPDVCANDRTCWLENKRRRLAA